MDQTTHAKHVMEVCMTACSRCHQVCLQTGMNHCLEAGGKHVKANHFRLLMNCAEICQASVNFMLSGSHFQHSLCGICAEICEACAVDCEKIGDMDECVEVCRDCADTCRQMANVRH